MNNLHDPEMLQMVFSDAQFCSTLLGWLRKAGRIRASVMTCFFRLSPLVPVALRKMLLILVGGLRPGMKLTRMLGRFDS